MPTLPPFPRLPEIMTVQDDCYLGVHARFVVPPNGVAGVLWKLQLTFDRWEVGVHVFAVFSRWDDRGHIDISRFPARVVDFNPPEAMRSPTMGGGEAYKRPPGKVEFVLRETPVTTVVISMYGGARDLGALYCARPEDPPPPPPKPRPTAPPPLAPPDYPRIHQHVEDVDAVITGAVKLHDDAEIGSKTNYLTQLATAIVAFVVFALAMVAGGFAFLVGFCKRMKYRMQGRKVRKKITEMEEMGTISSMRIKLLFEDDEGGDVAAFMELSEVETVSELHDLVVETYESAGVQTYRNDVLTLTFRDHKGRMVPLTEESEVMDIAAGGMVRLTRSSKAKQKQLRSRTYARISCNFEPETAAADVPEYGDDDDAFEVIMQSRERGRGTLALTSPAASGPVLPGAGGGAPPAARATKPRRSAPSARQSVSDDMDDSDDDAELIYNANVQTEASRAGVAQSMAL